MNRFCTQCGAQQKDTARFCTKCGVTLQPLSTMTREAPPTVAFDNMQVNNLPVKIKSSPPSIYNHHGIEGVTEHIAGMLCYPLSILTGILFLVTTPYNKDRFVRFHAYQSIFFFLELLAIKIMLGILPGAISWAPKILFGPAALVGTIWMMYEAYHGKMTKLPIIGEFAEKKANEL